MIAPTNQWCQQIEVTNVCTRRCSNCTRMLAHVPAPFVMPVDQFSRAVDALADFSQESGPDAWRQKHNAPPRKKIVGVMGGEPLLHPEFPELCRILAQKVPKGNRGLWTSENVMDDRHRYHALVRDTFGFNEQVDEGTPDGYLNLNRHDSPCFHQPVLVAIQEVVSDEDKMWALIEDCWLQQQWAGCITPKGYFFCEVAGALDMVFGGPGGVPVTPGCWQHDLAEYRAQIERWCPHCGICLPLRGRLDSDERDDVSHANASLLILRGSPRMKQGAVDIYDPAQWQEDAARAGWEPSRYLR